MSTLKPGEQLRTRNGLALKVDKQLGEGGQGTVYQVIVDGGKKYALKWYHPPTQATERSYEEQRRALVEGSSGNPALVDRKPPDTRFLWPLDYVEQEMTKSNASYRGYGYIMDLRTSEYASIEELVLGKVRFTRSQGGGLRPLCTAAMGIVDSFRVLHLKGLCYKDINSGGPFFNPKNGEVLICDNDNVRVNGTPGLIYFMEYAAPEVNLGKANCTTRTDEHSLAVLLFLMFCRGNPLEGQREINTFVFENNAKLRTFGKDPVFIFDPNNNRNRPVSGIQSGVINNWARLPRLIQKEFIQVFTEGLRDPDRRVNDTQWLHAFSRLRDALYPCARCGLESFYDRSRVQAGSTMLTCSFCKHQNPMPARIRLGDRKPYTVVLLTSRTKLYPHHFGRPYDFSKVVAEMVQHPKNPSRWGLKNLSNKNWIYKDNNGSEKDVPPGRSLVLKQRRTVNFGGTPGLIRI